MRAVQNVTCGPALEKRDRRTLLIREAIACLCPGPSTSAELPVNVVNFSWPSLSCNILFSTRTHSFVSCADLFGFFVPGLLMCWPVFSLKIFTPFPRWKNLEQLGGGVSDLTGGVDQTGRHRLERLVLRNCVLAICCINILSSLGLPTSPQ